MVSAGSITVDVVPRLVSGYQHNTAPCDHGADCLDCTPIFATLILNAVLDQTERLDRVEKLLMTEATQIQTATDAITVLATEIGQVDAAIEAFKTANPSADFTPLTAAISSAKAAADQALQDATSTPSVSAPISDPNGTPTEPTTDGSDVAGTDTAEQPAPTETATDVPDAPSTDNVVIGADDSAPTA